MIALLTVQDHAIALPRGAAQCDAVGVQVQVAGHHVVSIRDQDGSARPRIARGAKQLFYRFHSH